MPGARRPTDRPDFHNLATTLSELANEASGVSVEHWLAGIIPSVSTFTSAAAPASETVSVNA